MTTPTLRTRSDLMGALASGLCVVHCLATPVLFLAGAGAAHAHGAAPGWWAALDFLFLVVSFFAVRYSASKTSISWMPAAMYAAWGLLALIILNEKLHLLHLSHALIFLPALGLVGLHLYNRRVGAACALQA